MRRSKNSESTQHTGTLAAPNERPAINTACLPTRSDTPNRFVTLHIQRQIQRRPTRNAVMKGSQKYSYRSLDIYSNRVAQRLREKGVGVGAHVAIAADATLESVVAVLGVLKAGAAYVPIDVGQPAGRKQFMLDDTKAQFVVGRTQSAQNLATAGRQLISVDEMILAEERKNDTHAPLLQLSGAETAYVIYTSGSTGKPKGVLVNHDNLRSSNEARIQYYDHPVSRFLLLSPLYFDSSVAGLFWTLTSGGTLVLPSNDVIEMPHRLPNFIANNRITQLLCIPSLWRLVLRNAQPGQLESLKTVIVAGEACPDGLPSEHRNLLPETQLFNEYGPTEGTVWATASRIDNLNPCGTVSIGKPIPNTRVYIVDQKLRPVMRGEVGELCLAGGGVAQGYLNQPELTARNFVKPNQRFIDEHRIYKTGDLARALDDGNLELVGRIDNQLKIRGYRVDPGEIEATLCQHPMIEESAILSYQNASGATRLVAFVIGATSCVPLSTNRLGLWVRDRLPDYMLPERYEVLDVMPRNRNGKVDREALAAIINTSSTFDLHRSKPKAFDPNAGVQTVHAGTCDSVTDNVMQGRDALEFELLQIWREVLPGVQVDLDTDFFKAGGDSLGAFDLLSRVKQRLGIDLTIKNLLTAKSVCRLTLALRRKSLSPSSPLVPLKPDGDLKPMYMVHPGGGNALCYFALSQLIHPRVPFYGIQAPGFDGLQKPLATVHEMAATYVKVLRELQPEGPYRVGGWSFGGIVAYEMGRLLRQSGNEVELLAIIDAGFLYAFAILRMLLPENVPLFHLPALLDCMVQGEFLKRCIDAHVVPPHASAEQKKRIFELFVMNVNATLEYRPESYDGKISLLLGNDKFVTVKHNPMREWQRVCANVDVQHVPGHHFTILKQPNVGVLAETLNALLEVTSDLTDKRSC